MSLTKTFFSIFKLYYIINKIILKMEQNTESKNLIIKKEFFIRQTDGQITQYYEVLKK